LAENWHFFGFVVLLIAAFGFVYFASIQPDSDYSGKGIRGGTRGVGSCKSTGYLGTTSGGYAYMLGCRGCYSNGDCCRANGGVEGGPGAIGQDTICTQGNREGYCTVRGCVFQFPQSVSPSPSPTARGPLVTARPTLTVRTTATPSVSGGLNTTGCGGNRLCKSVCVQGYSCTGAVSGACGGRCVKTLTASTPRPSIG